MASIPQAPTTGVVVTGGASGIGRACALAVAEAGRPVAAWDLDGAAAKETAEEAARRFGVAATSAGIDVTDSSLFATAIEDARSTLGSIGGLVHAAGVSRTDAVEELDEEKWDFVLDVNLRAAALLAKALLPDLEQHEGSAIVNIASINAILGNGRNPAYGASKSGLLGLTRAIADRFGSRGIRANCICPGYIRTPMLQPSLDNSPEMAQRMNDTCMLERLGEPEDIGKVARFLLSTEAGFITATEVVVDGGVTRSQR